ncbi:hypothetical protein SAMN05428975_2481 [Mucilaginibacter sp. OK268]|nr:hypothetical protein SAMN05428975_2481 [Mucilaginibacter sp. OK268]
MFFKSKFNVKLSKPELNGSSELSISSADLNE